MSGLFLNNYLIIYLGLKARSGPDYIDNIKLNRFSFHNNEGIIYTEPSGWDWVNSISMIWRYGLMSLVRMKGFISDLLVDFSM